MNELMISYGNGNYIYFKTRATTAWDAYHEFVRVCGTAGVNIDNTNPTKAELRDDESLETISVWKFF